MLKIRLEILWKILCKKHSKVWLALPIDTANQRIIKIKIDRKPKKKVKKEFYSYIYFETPKTTKIKAELSLELNKISKYKDVVNKKFLKNNKILRIDKTKLLATKLKTPKKFYKWIIENVKFPKDLSKYLTNLNWTETAVDVLRNKEGECGGKSLLFVSLCRAVGIPARLVSGYFLKSGEISLFNASLDKNSLELHQWAEFYDGNCWVPVDCSLAQEEGKNYFGKFDDYRVVVSKDMNFRLENDETVPFLQIGKIKPKDLNNTNIIKIIKVRKWKK